MTAHPLLDETNSESLVNLFEQPNGPVPRALARVLESANKDLFDMPDLDLKREIRARFSHNLNQVDHRVRMNFWREYDLALAKGIKIRTANLYSGVMSQQAFSKYVSNDAHVAWMLCPITSYTTFVEEGLMFGLDRMREYLALDPVDPVTGKINTKLIDIQVKITALLDMRKHGAFTQKIQNQNVNYTIPGPERSGTQELPLEQIQERIKYLEKQKTPARDAVAAGLNPRPLPETSREELAEIIGVNEVPS